MTLQVKDGVDLSMIDPRMWPAVWKIERIYAQYGLPCTITSGRDGRHSARSKHYYGTALDFRTWGLTEGQKLKMTAEISEAVGNEFDVVLEADHLHVEYDPK